MVMTCWCNNTALSENNSSFMRIFVVSHYNSYSKVQTMMKKLTVDLFYCSQQPRCKKEQLTPTVLYMSG